MMKLLEYICVLLALLLTGCDDKKAQPIEQQKEDSTAKELLQGVWIDADDEMVAFRAKGDSIYYPDSTSVPAHFKIVKDTLVLSGTSVVKYPIIKQSAHLFVFKNHAGDEVKLIKSEQPADEEIFKNVSLVAVNQNRLIKRDTIVRYNDTHYHGYVQVNPTTYKVIKATYNDDGVKVDNIYYDNIIHLAVYRGGSKVLSRNFGKDAFAHLVPADVLKQSVLSDMLFAGIDSRGLNYDVMIAIPDSPSSYMVSLIIGYDGKMKMQLKE